MSFFKPRLYTIRVEMMFTAKENYFIFLFVISHADRATAVSLDFSDCLMSQVFYQLFLFGPFDTICLSHELIVDFSKFNVQKVRSGRLRSGKRITMAGWPRLLA